MAGDKTPHEAPTNRLVLAEEDLDRIATAIRDGLGQEPPDGKKLLWDAVRVVGAFSLLVLVYFFLTHWRPAVDISVQASSLSTPQVLTHDSEEDDVAFRLGTGQVRALTVDEVRMAEQADGEFMISLPISRTDCAEVAARLDAACDDAVIEVQAPVTVAWTQPQVLQLNRVTTADLASSGNLVPQELKLDLKLPAADPAEMTREATGESAEESEAARTTPPLPQLTIDDQRAASQRWCFTYQRAGGAATLSITGGSAGYEQPFEPASAPDTDCDAVQLKVTPSSAATTDADESQDARTATSDQATGQASDEARRSSSLVTLSGVSSLNVTTDSRLLSASALTGSLRLLQDVRVFDTATRANFAAGEPITSTLEIRAGTPSLTINGTGVKSIETDRGNLVSTVWQRHSELMLPIFIGVVGVFTPLLGTVYRNGVDYLANRRLSSGSASR